MKIGNWVCTLDVEPKAKDWTPEALANRRFGVLGTIIAIHDSHGLCYDVLHQGSVGSYEPHELQPLNVPVVR